jgi:hypothetical protein
LLEKKNNNFYKKKMKIEMKMTRTSAGHKMDEQRASSISDWPLNLGRRLAARFSHHQNLKLHHRQYQRQSSTQLRVAMAKKGMQ